jgi:dihydroneopterin aldolase
MIDDRSAAVRRHDFRPARGAARSTLRIHRLELDVRLGCEAEERATTQKVELDATLRFATTPAACRTDRLADTVCYAELGEIARALASAREYRLVEHLGHELYAAFRDRLPDDARLELVVRKVAPPVPGLLGGVSFAIEEEEEVRR